MGEERLPVGLNETVGLLRARKTANEVANCPTELEADRGRGWSFKTSWHVRYHWHSTIHIQNLYYYLLVIILVLLYRPGTSHTFSFYRKFVSMTRAKFCGDRRWTLGDNRDPLTIKLLGRRRVPLTSTSESDLQVSAYPVDSIGRFVLLFQC